MATYNGTNLRIFIDGTLVGGENETTISFSHEPRDSNTKDSPWNSNEEGSLSAEISGSGFVVAPVEGTLDRLFDALVNANSVSVLVGTNIGGLLDTSKHRWSGQFRLTSFEDSGSHRDTRTYSYTLMSVGVIESIAIPPLQYLYAAVSRTGTSFELAVIDVSDPTSPSYLGNAHSTGVITPTLSWHQAIIDSTHIYTTYQRVLRIFDWKTDPENISQIGDFTDATKEIRNHIIRLSPTRVLINGGLQAKALLSFDITTKTAPTLLSESVFIGSLEGDTGCVDKNSKSWVGYSGPGTDGLFKTDTAEPLGTPASFFSGTTFNKKPNAIVGDYLYQMKTPNTSSDLEVYKISTGTPVLESGSPFNFGFQVNYMGLRGTQLFMATSGSILLGSIQVLDVSDPTTPTLIKHFPKVTSRDPFGGTQFVINGDHLYVVSRRTSFDEVYLLVWDISTITSPTLVANLNLTTGNSPRFCQFLTGFPNELQDEARNINIA